MKGKGTFHPLLILVASWVIARLAAGLAGEFPLNDDWAYAAAVRDLVDRHQFRLSDWGAMTFVFQLGWGALFCLPGGFSFMALRISTMVLAIIVLLTVYRILIILTGDRAVASAGTGTVAFSPLFFHLSGTFMTDVPFLAPLLLAVLFFLEFMRNDQTGTLVAAAGFAVMAVMVRQTGLALPLAFGIALVLLRGASLRTGVRAVFPAMACVMALVGYETVLRVVEGLPRQYSLQTGTVLNAALQPSGEVVKRIAYHPVTISLIVGVLIAPLTLPAGVAWLREGRKPRRAVLIAAGVVSAYLGLVVLRAVFTGKFLPFAGDVFYHFGLGPVILKGVVTDQPPLLGWGQKAFWSVVTLWSALGFGALAVLLPRALKRQEQERFAAMCSLAMCVVFTLVHLSMPLFDRYALTLLPFAVIIIGCADSSLRTGTGRPRVAPWLLLLPLAVFSVTATHDYMAMNEARWRALGHLTQEMRVAPEEIDGGFEFNGWYLFGKGYPGKDEAWWWVKDDRYVVTTTVLGGYTVKRTYGYSRWLGGQNGSVYLLERDSAPSD